MPGRSCGAAPIRASDVVQCPFILQLQRNAYSKAMATVVEHLSIDWLQFPMEVLEK